MIEQLKTIREAHDLLIGGDLLCEVKAAGLLRAALTQLEAMVGKQEPVADINVRPSESGGTIASVFSHKLPVGSWLLYRAAPVAQQPNEWSEAVLDWLAPTGKDFPTDTPPREIVKWLMNFVHEVAQQPQADLIPVAAFDRLMALCESQAQRIIELEDKQPQAEAVPPDVVRDAMVEAACGAVAAALGDAYDCGRVWSAWSYGTMGPDDFSQVSEDSDRVREIAVAAIDAAIAQQKGGV